MPEITVVIPVYNRIVYLGATIASVIGQTYTAWELIVVDDGSAEDVAGLVAQFSEARIRYVRQENQGNGAARNTGIRQAAGRYIICLDSDDIWHPEMLEACAERLQADPAIDVVYSQFRQIDGQGAPIPQPIGPTPRNGDLLEPLLLGFPVLPSSALVRRSCFERWGAYTPGFDDWEMWLRWAVQGCRFACLERPLLDYRVHEQNFNLNWPKRHQVHMEMLGAFYSRPSLPAAALRIREQVYAAQHVYFGVLAWQLGRPDDAYAELGQLFRLRPEAIGDLDLYTRLACVHQGRNYMGTAQGLSLAEAEQTLNDIIRHLGAQRLLPGPRWGAQGRALGFAYLALARLAYGVPHDMPATRRLLARGLAHWPPMIWQTDWLTWLGRALVGYEAIQGLRRWRAGNRPVSKHA